MKKIFVNIILLLLIPSLVNADNRQAASFINMSGNETMWVKINNDIKVIRMYGVKTTSSYSNKAINYIKNALKNKKIFVEILDISSNKNEKQALIFVDNKLFQKELIETGNYQLSQNEYLNSNFSGLCNVQEKAYKAHKGIWAFDTEEIVCHNKEKQYAKKTKKITVKKEKSFSKSVLYKLLFLESLILILLIIKKVLL